MKRQAFIGLAVLAAALLPAWAVNSASQHSRNIWVGSVLFLAFLSASAGSAAISSPSRTEWSSGPYEGRYVPYVNALAGISFLAAELVAIGLTYAEPDKGILGPTGRVLSEIGATLFPVIARYETSMDPPLSPLFLFRTQSIVSVFLLAGLVTFFAYAAYWIRMPRQERRNVLRRGSHRPLSGGVAVLCCLGAGAWLAAIFFGFGEFKLTESKFCLIQAPCYLFGGDLVVFTAALAKSLPLACSALFILMVVLGILSED